MAFVLSDSQAPRLVARACLCGNLIFKKQAQWCNICENYYQNHIASPTDKVKKMPGEHHGHLLHYGEDIKSARKKAAIEREKMRSGPLPELNTRVVISVRGPDSDCLIGTVRYTGKTIFAGGDWIGIELDRPLGKNSGTMCGVKYFECAINHGIFVKPNSVIAMGDNVLPFMEEERNRLKNARKRADKRAKLDKEDKEKLQLTGELLPSYYTSYCQLVDKVPEIGQRVVAKAGGKKYNGEVRYVGTPRFAGGLWIGICLDIALGKNDGTVDRVKYFECPANHGLFARADACSVVTKDRDEEDKQKEESALLDQDRANVEALDADELRFVVRKLRQDKSSLSEEMNQLQAECQELASSYEDTFKSSIEYLEKTPDSIVKRTVKKGSSSPTLRAAKGDVTQSNNSAGFQMGLAKVFHGLDRNKDGRLYVTELHRLAMALEYEDTVQAFNTYYKQLCAASGCTPEQGIHVRAFVLITSDQEDEDNILFIPDSGAVSILKEQFCAGEAMREEREASQSDRLERLQAICEGADKNGNSYIDGKEFFSIVQLLGYTGSQEQYLEEYEELCEAWVWDSGMGIPVMEVAKQLNKPGSDYFLNQSLLQDFEKEFTGEESQRKRRLGELFDACDTSNTGAVQLPAMYTIAKVLGFEESQESFATEFADLCKQYKCDVEVGIQREVFLAMTSTSDSTYFIEDMTKIDVIIKALAELQKAPSRPPAEGRSEVADVPSEPADVRNDSVAPVQSEAADVPVEPADVRSALVAELFRVLDAGKTGKLFADQMHKLAQQSGYPDDVDTFKADGEYENLCEILDVDAKLGLDAAAFQEIVSNEDSDYYADEDTLRQIVTSLGGTLPPDKAATPAAAPATKGGARPDRLEALFGKLDSSKSGILRSGDILKVAERVGFEDGEAAFMSDVYPMICEACECEPSVGFNLEAFLKLCNTQEDDDLGNFYLEDEELEKWLAEFPTDANPPSEDKLVSARDNMLKTLYEYLCNGKAALDSLDLFKYAQKIGYPEGEEAFAETYDEICQDFGVKVVDQSVLANMVNDENGDYYSTDDDLAAMLKEFGISPGQVQESVVAPPAAAPLPPTGASLFTAADKDDNGNISESEMLELARLLGFDGDASEFTEMYAGLCEEYECDNKVGLDDERFLALIEDREGDFFVEADQLPEFIEALAKQKAALKPASVSAPSPVDTKAKPILSRAEKLDEIFKAADIDGDSRLSFEEMFEVAVLVGFPQGLEEFSEEYEDICGGCGADPGTGIDVEAFKGLTNDTGEEASYYMEDKDLDDYLQSLRAKRPPEAPIPSARSIPDPAPEPAADEDATQAQPPTLDDAWQGPIQKLFKAVDANRDGRIDCGEMFRVAQVAGFEGPAEDFEPEWQDLCKELQCDPGNGLDDQMFAKVVGDADSNYYIEASEVDMNTKQISQAVAKRIENLQKLFAILDTNSRGCLLQPEMFRFAQLAGFPDGLDVFAEEYGNICNEMGVTPQDGFAGSTFLSFASKYGSDYFADDATVLDMVAQLSSSAKAPEVAPDLTPDPSANKATDPSDGYKQIFELLDESKSGRLTSKAIFLFASLQGYEDDFATFVKEEVYEALCDDAQSDPAQGVDMASFVQVISADPELNWYVEQEQVQSFIRNLTPPKSRTEYLSRIFQALDRDSDGFIVSAELHRFAQFMGYEDPLEDFDTDVWQGVCEEFNGDLQKGIKLEAFDRLVSQADGEFNLLDDELQEAWRNLRCLYK